MTPDSARPNLRDLVRNAEAGRRLDAQEALAFADYADLSTLMEVAAALRDAGHGRLVSYSRKVFIPLTQLCRDVCHYCTFAHPPRRGERAYLSRDEVLAIARAGAAAGCKEALFTLGDKPELRYDVAREELRALGHETTIGYLVETARLVFEETGLLPHANPGVLSAADIAALRAVSVSQGLMLESSSERLCERGGPHFGSPDKYPAIRLQTIRLAGEAAVPFTSGILIGIGETRRERVDALLAIRDLHERHGHIQEIIVQNFRAKRGTRMAARACHQCGGQRARGAARGLSALRAAARTMARRQAPHRRVAALQRRRARAHRDVVARRRNRRAMARLGRDRRTEIGPARRWPQALARAGAGRHGSHGS